MDSLRQWIINITTVAIFIVILEIMLPSGKMKKMVNLISGFILIISIIYPLSNVVSQGIKMTGGLFEDSGYFSGTFDKKKIQNDGSAMKEEQIKQIVQLYREKVINHIKESVKKVKGVGEVNADITFIDDYSSENFGQLKRIYIYVTPEKDRSEDNSIKAVEKVQIGKEAGVPKKEVVLDPEIVSKIQLDLSGLFNIDKEDIIVLPAK